MNLAQAQPGTQVGWQGRRGHWETGHIRGVHNDIAEIELANTARTFTDGQPERDWVHIDELTPLNRTPEVGR